MNEPKGRERRRAPRIAVDFPVALTCGRKQYRCQALEFSEFGIFLASARKELVGEDVELGLALDTKNPSRSIKGVVAYATNTGIGVRFKSVSPELQMDLKNYIQANSPTKAPR